MIEFKNVSYAHSKGYGVNTLNMVIEEGDFVLCAVSRKEIMLKDLNYWNVELQEAYFSPIEVNERYKNFKKL